MMKKLEEFLFGKVMGRVIARVAVSVAAFVVGQAAAHGVHLDPGELSAALITGANAAYTAIKDWRDKRLAAAQLPAPAKP